MRPLTALVPIKGESERVPGKNLRDFCGRPLLCRVLAMLQQTGCIERIVVNTDSDAVAELVAEFGKTCIHKRPSSLRGHNVSMNRILAHDLELLGEGHYLQTHVTNPLLTGRTVNDAVEIYFSSLSSYDSLFSVLRHQSRFFAADQRPLNHDLAVLLNTQDLPPLYEENSCLYIFSYDSFFENNMNRIGKHFLLYPMSKMESLDIDTEDDFHLAQLAYRIYGGYRQ
jgi:CMP-N-acetylneuraminic acid synthetase